LQRAERELASWWVEHKEKDLDKKREQRIKDIRVSGGVLAGKYIV
jgi:hypothetical protein